MQKRILELDGFRGIAVLIVVLCHFNSLLRSPRTLPWKMLERTLDSGWVGVDIFFVLSGFLITIILLDDHDWKRFYRNRAFRILPAFLVVFSAVLCFIPTPPLSVIVAYLLFVGNFTNLFSSEIFPLRHLWSLSIEEQFYLVWPQVVWRCSKPTILKIAISLAVLSVLCRFAAAAAGLDPFVIYKMTPTHLDGISLGCAVAAASRIPSANEWLKRHWKTIAWISASLFLLGFLALRLNYFGWDVKAQMIAIPTVSVFAGSMVFAGSQRLMPPALSAVLRQPVLVYLGLRSYGLYLIHLPIEYALSLIPDRDNWLLVHAGALPGTAAMSLLGIALSVALAELSWRLVEQPAQRLKKLVSDRGPVAAK
jgi:peptidoglycan/LPS O-acetylase OafA/YrhL